jgi:AraC-like DNA-binding protein
VAFESGFRSVQHMTTAYAKAYGQTPGRHRRMLAL